MPARALATWRSRRTSMRIVVRGTPEFAVPSLKAVAGASDVAAAAIEVLDCKAPEQADRKLEIFDASEDGAIDNFVAAIKAAL